jgi:hypothetical protein
VTFRQVVALALAIAASRAARAPATEAAALESMTSVVPLMVIDPEVVAVGAVKAVTRPQMVPVVAAAEGAAPAAVNIAVPRTVNAMARNPLNRDIPVVLVLPIRRGLSMRPRPAAAPHSNRLAESEIRG